ncbi:hypothetical protein, partial [Xanthovirga aplysinae]|uniref:hypothetical protein n=1 Tax=Xanthovirga aplysinae TaxID=2529853 RepID=UPI001CA39DF1
EQFLLVHDKYDKIINFRNSTDIHQAIEKADLISFEKIGHYRMLWNEQVIQTVSTYFTKRKKAA